MSSFYLEGPNSVTQAGSPLLVQTLVQSRCVDRVKLSLGFDSLFQVNRDGRSGGLALFWKADVDLHINSFCQHHIDAIIHEPVKGHRHFIGFYGFAARHAHRESLTLLRTLASSSDLP